MGRPHWDVCGCSYEEKRKYPIDSAVDADRKTRDTRGEAHASETSGQPNEVAFKDEI